MTEPASAPTVDRRPALLLGVAIAVTALAVAVGAALVAARADAPTPAAVGAEDVGRLLADPTPPPAPEDRAGEPAPTAGFERLDGGTASLADYRGRPLVVNFFASWCVPCVEEMPAFEQVHQRVGDRVAFVGLQFNEEAAAGRRLAEQTGVTYDLGRDPDGALFTAFGAVGMPTTAFVAADGTIVEVVTGALTRDELERRVADLLAVRPA